MGWNGERERERAKINEGEMEVVSDERVRCKKVHSKYDRENTYAGVAEHVYRYSVHGDEILSLVHV